MAGHLPVAAGRARRPPRGAGPDPAGLRLDPARRRRRSEPRRRLGRLAPRARPRSRDRPPGDAVPLGRGRALPLRLAAAPSPAASRRPRAAAPPARDSRVVPGERPRPTLRTRPQPGRRATRLQEGGVSVAPETRPPPAERSGYHPLSWLERRAAAFAWRPA